MKKPLSRTVLTKAENETEIQDAKELGKALFLMGYGIANKVIKDRYTAHFKDFEICIDEVEGMRTFIEVEKMSEEDVDLVRKDLNKFLQSLGVPLEDEVHRGYDILAIEKSCAIPKGAKHSSN